MDRPSRPALWNGGRSPWASPTKNKQAVSPRTSQRSSRCKPHMPWGTCQLNPPLPWNPKTWVQQVPPTSRLLRPPERNPQLDKGRKEVTLPSLHGDSCPKSEFNFCFHSIWSWGPLTVKHFYHWASCPNLGGAHSIFDQLFIILPIFFPLWISKAERGQAPIIFLNCPNPSHPIITITDAGRLLRFDTQKGIQGSAASRMKFSAPESRLSLSLGFC